METNTAAHTHSPAPGSVGDGARVQLIEGLVSIIIPIYNVEQYLHDTLDSVCKQTYPNWECICVDDGSRDGSAQIVEHIAARDARFHLVRQRNSGAAAARNTGLAHARGEFLAFLDSDDLMRPALLEICVARLHADNSDICAFHLASLIDGKVTEDIATVLPEAAGTHCCYETTALRGRLFTCTMAGPCNKVYRTKLILEHGVGFPRHIKRCEDASFAVLALAASKRISFVGESLYLYRIARAGSQTSGMGRPEVCLDFIESCRISWDTLRDWGLLPVYGVDNIMHTWLVSLYYFKHLPSLGYVLKAYAMLNRMVRDNLRELESLGVRLGKKEKAGIRQYKSPVRRMYIRRIIRFTARYTGVEKVVHTLAKLIGK